MLEGLAKASLDGSEAYMDTDNNTFYVKTKDGQT